MDHLKIIEILNLVRDGSLSPEEARKQIDRQSFEELDFAKLDLHRAARTGTHEVVYCEGKPLTMLPVIYQKLYEANGEAFGTRASAEQYEAVRAVLPQVEYDPISRILQIRKEKERVGLVAVVSAGTADIPVAEEAAATAEYLGAGVDRIYDIGVCGLHRLLSRLEEIRKANCIVAVAGMEGALVSVLGGLVSVPIIAVPTSVGYGASMKGTAALLAMINSCANGISVVNIDNGYGGGYNAALINRLAVGAKDGRAEK